MNLAKQAAKIKKEQDSLEVIWSIRQKTALLMSEN
jgi:hypothetical protein